MRAHLRQGLHQQAGEEVIGGYKSEVTGGPGIRETNHIPND